MRRTALLSAAAVSTVLLSACGGGPEALSKEDAEAALLTEENFPLDGYKKTADAKDDSSDSNEEDSFEDLVFMFDGVSDGCKDAGKSIDEAETFSAQEKDSTPQVRFTKGDAVAEVSITEKRDDYEDAMDALEKLADECGELKGGPLGAKMSFEHLDEDGAEGMKMKMGVMGEVQEFSLLATPVGDNVVSASGEQMSTEDVKKIVDEQKKVVEEQ